MPQGLCRAPGSQERPPGGERLIARAGERGEDAEPLGRRVLAEAAKKPVHSMKAIDAKRAAGLAEKRLRPDAVEEQDFKAE